MQVDADGSGEYKQQFIPKGWYCIACDTAIWDNQRPKVYRNAGGAEYTFDQIVKLASDIDKTPDFFIESYGLVKVE